MKKHLIAAIVGGIIIFFWQFLSNAALDLHRPAQQYTAKQDTILSFLKTQVEPGRYFLPSFPEGTSADEQQAKMKEVEGKPWAIVDYHASWSSEGMIMNMARGLLVDIFIVYLFVWILTRTGIPSFGNIFLASVFMGLIAFLNFPYAYFIWYKSPGIWSDFMDAIVAWAGVGAWLGWYLNRK
ncbi:MAG TPA: hypothetical protein VK166_04370 [Chitinophagaceae bacterium]|nr:hypothetical protein [Chitinophagaceae bacterium]